MHGARAEAKPFVARGQGRIHRPYHLKANRSLKLFVQVVGEVNGLVSKQPRLLFHLFQKPLHGARVKIESDGLKTHSSGNKMRENMQVCAFRGGKPGLIFIYLLMYYIELYCTEDFFCVDFFFVIMITNALFIGSGFHLECAIWIV